MDARAANDRIAEKAERLQFVSRVPMLCECNRPGCRTIVMISLDDYREIRKDAARWLVASGHPADRAGRTTATADYEISRTDHAHGDDRCA